MSAVLKPVASPPLATQPAGPRVNIAFYDGPDDPVRRITSQGVAQAQQMLALPPEQRQAWLVTQFGPAPL